MKLFIDDIICFSKDGEQHVCDLRRFPKWLTRFGLKLARNKALLGAAEIIFLEPKISSEGVGPDPYQVKAMEEMPMLQNVSQLRSLLGALSYYRRQLLKMAARTRPLNSLLRKGVQFEFTPHQERIVREILDDLSSPNVFAFPDFEAAISGSRKFRLVTDANTDRLGVVREQQQPDGSIRPLRYLSRTTLDNERKWDISELECTAIVWAIKRNRQMFYGIPVEVETDHQPLQNLARLSDKSNRVQRWFDFLNVYTFTLKHRFEERERERRRPVAPTFPCYRRRSSAQISPDRPLGPRCLFHRCQRNSPVTTSNIVGLKVGLTGHRLSGGLANALGALATTPDDVSSWSTGTASCVEEILDGGRGST